MRNPQATVFRKRLKRIDRIHRFGGGFEAYGTLGQSFYSRQTRRRTRRVVRPMLYMIGVVITSKALLLANLGQTEYLARVSALQSGASIEKVGSYIMGLDPATVTLSTWLSPLFG